MEESEDIKGSTYLQMWQFLPTREAGEEAGGKTLKICWESFVLKKVLSLCDTELGEREAEKGCIRWRNSFHIFVVLFPDQSGKGSSIFTSPGDAALRAA